MNLKIQKKKNHTSFQNLQRERTRTITEERIKQFVKKLNEDNKKMLNIRNEAKERSLTRNSYRKINSELKSNKLIGD